jgi:glycosyltransferase involved in cell wall biosynthesis
LLGDAPIHCIPHGLDHDLFYPRDSGREQKKLSIADDQKIVLFVSHSVDDSRKGFSLLLEALRTADLDGALLLSVGSGEPDVPKGMRHQHLGHVDDDNRLAVLYSLADVFVIPSLQEAFGQTALESMACGTPVVGFDTGGIPDMVRPNETGWLAETGDIRSLRRAIETALAYDAERERKAARCREVVEEEYTLQRQAERYISLYESIQ